MTAMEILVIILSIFLTIFLVIGIVLAVLLIKVTRQIRRVTTRAEKTVISLEGVASGISKLITPAMLTKIVMQLIKKKRK